MTPCRTAKQSAGPTARSEPKPILGLAVAVSLAKWETVSPKLPETLGPVEREIMNRKRDILETVILAVILVVALSLAFFYGQSKLEDSFAPANSVLSETGK